MLTLVIFELYAGQSCYSLNPCFVYLRHTDFTFCKL